MNTIANKKMPRFISFLALNFFMLMEPFSFGVTDDNADNTSSDL